MRAGLLNEIISIYRLVEKLSVYGDISTSYQEVYTTRALVLHSLGKRELQNNEIFYDYSKTFIIRLYVDVLDTDRILYDGKYYRIISIAPDRQKLLKVILTEVINE